MESSATQIVLQQVLPPGLTQCNVVDAGSADFTTRECQVSQKLLKDVQQSKDHLIDAYQVLGVHSICSSHDVKAAYRLGSYPKVFCSFYIVASVYCVLRLVYTLEFCGP